jgi:hypothetical protein
MNETSAMKRPAKPGIVHETTGRNDGRIYAYDKYLMVGDIFSSEPLYYSALFGGG